MAFRAAELKRLFPRAAYDYFEMERAFADGVKKYSIDTPRKLKHVLSQMATESGGFKSFAEDLSYKTDTIQRIFGVGRHSAAVTSAEAVRLTKRPYELAERVYGVGNPKKSREFKNTNTGDGYKYRGRTPIQITGKRAYEELSKRMGKDYVSEPERLEKGHEAFMAAFDWIANKPGLLKLMESSNSVTSVRQKVNGGTNGLDHAIEWHDKINRLVSDADLSMRIGGVRREDDIPEEVRLETEADTAIVQQKLKDLGYQPGKVDGKYGPRTRDAIAAFEKDNGLKNNGKISDKLIKALEEASPRPERDVSMEDLKAGKSKTVATGDMLKNTAIVAPAGALVVEMLPSKDTIERASDAVDKLNASKDVFGKITEFATSVLAFVQTNATILLLIGGALIVWKLANDVQMERLKSARSGENTRI